MEVTSGLNISRNDKINRGLLNHFDRTYDNHSNENINVNDSNLNLYNSYDLHKNNYYLDKQKDLQNNIDNHYDKYKHDTRAIKTKLKQYEETQQAFCSVAQIGDSDFFDTLNEDDKRKLNDVYNEFGIWMNEQNNKHGLFIDSVYVHNDEKYSHAHLSMRIQNITDRGILTSSNESFLKSKYNEAKYPELYTMKTNKKTNKVKKSFNNKKAMEMFRNETDNKLIDLANEYGFDLKLKRKFSKEDKKNPNYKNKVGLSMKEHQRLVEETKRVIQKQYELDMYKMAQEYTDKANSYKKNRDDELEALKIKHYKQLEANREAYANEIKELKVKHLKSYKELEKAYNELETALQEEKEKNERYLDWFKDNNIKLDSFYNEFFEGFEKTQINKLSLVERAKRKALQEEENANELTQENNNNLDMYKY